jgi:hypothetical protein
MDKGDRSRLFCVMDDLPRVEEWRRTLPLTTRLKLNHPNAVWRKFKAAYEPEKPRGDKPTLRDSVAGLSEEIAAKDREIADLRNHVAELTAAREVGGSSGVTATLPDAINGMLALIDDPVRWPDSTKATRTCNQLRKALLAATDVLKTGLPAPKAIRSRKADSTEATS